MKKQYENCGPTEILGHSPGVTFTADLSEFQEKTLIEGGGLKVVGEVPAEPVEPDTPDEPVEPVVPEGDVEPKVPPETPAGDKTPPEVPDGKSPPAPPMGGKGKEK